MVFHWCDESLYCFGKARVISRIERSDKNYKNANITKIRWCNSRGLSVPWISQETTKKSKNYYSYEYHTKFAEVEALEYDKAHVKE